MRMLTYSCLIGLAALVGCDTTNTKNANTRDINKATGTDTTTGTTTTTTTTTTDDDDVAKPDNTAVNERDADGDTKTPFDQGENEADRNTTAEIRRRVVDAPDMSVNAQNVKIITNAGNVTLRGPVENDAEREAIEKIAKDVAGADKVDNQLEVKP
jgi:hyperosmotically inducible protein